MRENKIPKQNIVAASEKYSEGQFTRGVNMEIKILDDNFSVCKVTDYSFVNLESQYCFIGKTDEENSLVCMTDDVPANTTERDDGWRAFRIQGILDFSLIGILSKISSLLAKNEIGIFAVSTYNTDYILTKKENFDKAIGVLRKAGYHVVQCDEENASTM